MVLIKIINYLKYEYYVKERCIKCNIIYFILYLFFSIYILEFIKLQKLNKKLKALPIYQQKIINDYFINVSSDFKNEKYAEMNDLASLFSLVNFSELLNESTKIKLKFELLNQLQKKPKRIENMNNFEDKIAYVDNSYNFGNSMVVLNNLIYYCEILNIRNIYISSNNNLPLSPNFKLNNTNITLISPSNIDLEEKNIFIFDKGLIYFQKVFKPEIRLDLLKDEIKKYLPKIVIDKKDLYIHIRSGDIFHYNSYKNINYAQPPICFYFRVIDNFKFRKILILSQDYLNPVIKILINHFPNIILTKNSLDTDIKIISNTYNLVGSMSSFLTTLLIINDNLQNFWEYDNYRLSQKYLHLHHDIYDYPIHFIIYKMKSSYRYLNEMFPWKNNKKQISLMLNEKCNSNFDIIKPSIKYDNT